MKITNISCTQFAGVRDRNVSLTDGINVIYGKNESGKSTLVNLISRTLFQNARLDHRRDKNFRKLYFPGSKKESSMEGDFADGTIIFETEDGIYTLTKEWGSDPRCSLSSTDGIVRDQRKIDEILREVLLYGEGVYSDILFSSQRNTDISLQTILDASGKSDEKQKIVDAVSQAFAETDGISVDAIEHAITAKIDEIAGKHWDIDREAPDRGSNGRKVDRWSKERGKILEAYYKLEDAKKVVSKISELEIEADRAADNYADKDKVVCKAEETCNCFRSFAERLKVQNGRIKAIERIENEISRTTEALDNWPECVARLEKAKLLQTEKANRMTLDKYETAKAINDEIVELSNGAANKDCPSDDEIKQVKSAQSKLASLENKLCGMNITAAIDLYGNNRMEITSLHTGDAVDVSDGIAAITEAVKITVPGVLEMQLAPADVDIASIETHIAEQEKILADIYDKYNVSSLEVLETLAKTISDSRTKLDNANSRLDFLLGTTSFEELKTAVIAITVTIRKNEEIDSDISELCGSTDIATFITRNQTLVEGYLKEYGSIDNLKARNYDLNAELKKEKDSVSGVDDIPAEYLSITDPDLYLKNLQDDLESKRRCREEAFKAKADAASRLESYKKDISGDPAAEIEKAGRIFDETKSLLTHWLHIEEVFKAQKEKIHANPMQDIADRFTHYLGVISSGKIESVFPEANKLNMNVYSNNNLLDYEKLSEGTKETVSLAFRLAVLDHLFPKGGGVIVFDDPFNDMDAERTDESCELIRECAKRHQVIFLTCKEKYLDLLEGNKIRM